MRVVGHNDQILVVAMLAVTVGRFILLGDTALCTTVENNTLLNLLLVEGFSCIGVWIVALRFDGFLIACHYLAPQLLLIGIIHPFPFHTQWVFLPVWSSAVLVYLTLAFYIDCVPLYYRALSGYERAADGYLQIINLANAVSVNDVNVRGVAMHPATAALGAYKLTQDRHGQALVVATPISSFKREDATDAAGQMSTGGSVRIRRNSIDD